MPTVAEEPGAALADGERALTDSTHTSSALAADIGGRRGLLIEGFNVSAHGEFLLCPSFLPQTTPTATHACALHACRISFPFAPQLVRWEWFVAA